MTARKALPWLLFFAAFAFFLGRAYPSIAPLDSAELSAVGNTLGVGHSPGYPLFSLAGRAWTSLIDLGNGAYRMNILSALLSAAAMALLAEGAAVTGWASGLCAGLTLLFAPAFQREALSTEVFALNTCLAALWVLMLGLGGNRRILFAAFLFGLALGNQHTLLLALPALVLAAVRDLPAEGRLRALGRSALRALPWFFLGLSIYLFIILRSRQDPVMNWEQPYTWDRFWGLVTRARYGTLALAQGGETTPFSLGVIWSSLQLFAEACLANLGWLWVVAALGLARLCLYSPWFAASTLFGWLLTGPFFFVLSKMGPGENSMTIMERFLPLSLVFVAPWVGAAPGWLPERLRPLVLLVFLLRPLTWAQARWELTHRDLILNHLRTLPPDSIFLADRADEVEFGSAHLLAAEGRRADVTLVDANAGVTPSIYGEDYYRIWGPPRLHRREAVEGDLIARSKVPVYYATVLPDQVKIAKEREGLLWRAKGPAHDLPWEELYTLRWDPDMPRREKVLAWSYYRLLGEAALDRNDPEAAAADFLAAAHISANPGYELHYAGVAFYQKGYYPEAVGLLERGVRFNPNALALSNLGAALEKVGDMKGAMAAYRKAVQVDPEMPQAHSNLGSACWRTQEWECAAAAFARAYLLDPKNTNARDFAEKAKQKIKNER